VAKIHRRVRELERENSFLKGLIESLSQPFYVIDAKTNETVLMNAAADRGLETGSVSCHALLYGKDQPCSKYGYFCPLPEIKRTKEMLKFERTYIDQAGKTVYIEVCAYPVLDEGGEVAQMIEYWVDITARKELENTLKETLARRNKILTSKAMQMSRTREMLLDLIKAVQALSVKRRAEDKGALKSILAKLNEMLDSGNEWDEFDRWFQEVHSDFYEKLKTLCSDLTLREMKICAFLKLGLNTKEIASLTNLTVKTIEVYRSQLRKKLKLTPGQNLVKFISEI